MSTEEKVVSIGPVVPAKPAATPERVELHGRLVSVIPLNAERDTPALWTAVRGSENDGLWTYLSDGPYATQDAFLTRMKAMECSVDPLFFSILDRTSGNAVGFASYLRIEPAHRVLEVGSILFTPALQRTPGATEAMYLMARHAFDDLGYRRYEWKCNAFNEPSRRAALRLGFAYEGTFRQHMIIKGRNRDTAWFAMLDVEWPAAKAAFEEWLQASNFDAQGRQIRALATLRANR